MQLFVFMSLVLTLHLKKLYKLQALSAALIFQDAERSFVEKSVMSPNIMYVGLATLLVLQKILNYLHPTERTLLFFPFFVLFQFLMILSNK
jgi:hypothetical protein